MKKIQIIMIFLFFIFGGISLGFAIEKSNYSAVFGWSSALMWATDYLFKIIFKD
jgi:hypothetical protein